VTSSETRARAATWLAGALAIAALAAGLRWGALVAGGSDSYGYVSEAGLWRRGELIVHEEIVRTSPWPIAAWTWSPLGYRPAPNHSADIVPVYSPGLPILMALFQLVGGFCGAFVVAPLSGALTIWCTYLLGRRVFGSSAVALFGATLVASSPVFLFQLMNAMSDVPVTGAWTAVLLLLVAGQPLAAGVAAAVAVAIRPNLALLVPVLCAWLVYRDRARGAIGFWRAPLRFAIGVAPAVVGVAWLNYHLYGSPFLSGYGPTSELYGFEHLSTNVRQFTSWMFEVETPLIAASIFYFLMPRRFAAPAARDARLLFGGVLATVALSYAFYQPFDAWWYLRFLLPAWPVLMLLTAAVVDGIVRRWLRSISPAALAAIAIAAVGHALYVAHARSAFDLARGEQRYSVIGKYVGRMTEPGAVILSAQHSGSVRLYGNRLTLRYELLDPAWLDRALEHLQSTGHHPYVVLDDAEVNVFNKRFRGQSGIAALKWPPLARFGVVGLYDLLDPRPRLRSLELPAPGGHVLCDAPQSWPASIGLGPL
jgi:hypothetical protein